MEDKYAFVEALAARHGDRLRRFLRPRVRNAADIPDIVQEVFLRLLRVPSHETIRTPEAYIFTVASHVAQQHSLQSAATAGALELNDRLAELQTATESDPVLEVIAEQCLEGLNSTLHQMSPKVQATFVLHRRDGLSVEEISERLGITQPMVKKYLVKALVQFRKRLSEME